VTDPAAPVDTASPGAPRSAGALLREARQARGLHVAALAASIKVTQRKLEALEADRYDELPDMTFTRALAKTVCRSLKIDSGPVLALLPEVGDRGLDRVHQGLNTTFRERPGRRETPDFGAAMRRPALWLPLLVLVAAAALLLAPPGWISPLGGTDGPTAVVPAAAPAPPAAASAQAPPPEAASAPTGAVVESSAPPLLAAGAASAPADLGSMLVLLVKGESWVEVLDAGGAALLQRVLQPGETVGLDGTPPFRIRIGNAAVTQLRYRGQEVDLAASTRDNVARLELK
jgi:cytoskeleton protein RodZ